MKARRFLPLSFERRFQFLVYQRGDCWEWRGRKSKLGYGDFYTWLGEDSEAHRFAYEMAKLPIRRGFEIDHICRHPWCVKPSHLEMVTHEENLRRANTNRVAQTHCLRGHLLPPKVKGKSRRCWCIKSTFLERQRDRR